MGAEGETRRRAAENDRVLQGVDGRELTPAISFQLTALSQHDSVLGLAES